MNIQRTFISTWINHSNPTLILSNLSNSKDIYLKIDPLCEITRIKYYFELFCLNHKLDSNILYSMIEFYNNNPEIFCDINRNIPNINSMLNKLNVNIIHSSDNSIFSIAKNDDLELYMDFIVSNDNYLDYLLLCSSVKCLKYLILNNLIDYSKVNIRLISNIEVFKLITTNQEYLTYKSNNVFNKSSDKFKYYDINNNLKILPEISYLDILYTKNNIVYSNDTDIQLYIINSMINYVNINSIILFIINIISFNTNILSLIDENIYDSVKKYLENYSDNYIKAYTKFKRYDMFKDIL